MPTPVSNRYFYEGVFKNPARGELFGHYTCLECSTRLKTWQSFRRHRLNCVAQQIVPVDLTALIALAQQEELEEVA
jgi:hypothetical protein